MTVLGCDRLRALPERLNDQQRQARTVVGLLSIGAAVLAARRTGALGALGAVAAAWFGASHLVAAHGLRGVPRAGRHPSVILRRGVQIGCVPWRIADQRLGLSA